MIHASEDLLLDIDRIDREQKGKLTEVSKHSIRRLKQRRNLSSEDISRLLNLDADEVENFLNDIHPSHPNFR